MEVNYKIPVTLFNYRESENSLYSFAKLKIFYIGMTQDKRLFTKDFSDQLLSSLPYVPVVGYYDEEEEDFKGHYEAVQYIYGVVPEDTSIEYMYENGMQYAICDVILYTGRLDRTGEIARKIVGKPHSLELNPTDTKYKINRNSTGKVENIEFTSGSLLGLSILGDKEAPAFNGSGFFSEALPLFTEDLRCSLNEAYQQCSFKQSFSRHSYENRRKRAYEALKEMYLDVKFEIKEMTDNYIHYFEYFTDQNGEQYVAQRIFYQDDGEFVKLIGGPEEVFIMYLTEDEVEMVEGYEPADSLKYRTLSDLDLKPTESMANNAKRGLEMRKEYGRGGTSVGVARARDLSNRKNLSPDTVRRMYSYFSRHEVDKQGKGWDPGTEGYPSNGRIAWLLWGGDSGYTWATSKWNQIKKIREAISWIENETLMDLDNMQESRPAPKKDQVTGSDDNKPGSAEGPGGDIKVSEETEKGLRNKVKEHNDKMKEENKPDHTRATYGQLVAVYRRGAGAYSSSHRPGMTRGQWAMARVNAYLYLLRNGKPENPKYITDYDLLPKEHPKSTRNNAMLITDETEVKLVAEKTLQEELTEASKVNAPVETPQIMEVKEEEKDEMIEHEDEEKDQMGEHEDEEKEKMDKDYDDEKEDMVEHDDEEKEEMGGHDDEEEKMVKEDKEEKMVEEEVPGTEKLEDDELDEETETNKSVKIETEEKLSSTTLSSSERTELEAFRRERKEGLISSFEDDLSNEFIEKLKTNINTHSIDELEVLLSKEYTRVNRATKTTKPNAFIYNPDSKPTTKSEADIVKELVQKYK